VAELTQDNVFVSDSGVQLKLKPVNSFLLLQAQNQIEIPKVPVVWLEDKQREEENPNDPTYVEALREAQAKRATKMTDLFLGFGTEVIYPLPTNADGGHDIPDPEDYSWIDDLTTILEVEVPENKRMRHVYWLKAMVLKDSEIIELLNRIAPLSGLVMEAAAEQAADTFQSEEGRDTTGAISDTEQD
jgi:hypothetical protein